MKVRELIEELESMDPNAEVFFQYNYGDYTRTEVAQKARNVDEDVPLKWSEYHRMHRLVEDTEDEDQEGLMTAVVISA